ENDKDILTITSNGYGKRTNPDDYRLQGRAGKGIRASVINEKTGDLVNMKLVSDGDEVILMTVSGLIIRIHADAISKIGRNTRGVRIMRVRDSEVATVDVTERDDEAETETPEETEIPADELAEGVAEEIAEEAETADETQSEAPMSEDSAETDEE
ncbi:MAG: DNA gyrase subunit A, partial [Clostridia bacterium]|nr:DNA gyrase subunit A [Clostridia bacterium]